MWWLSTEKYIYEIMMPLYENIFLLFLVHTGIKRDDLNREIASPRKSHPEKLYILRDFRAIVRSLWCQAISLYLLR